MMKDRWITESLEKYVRNIALYDEYRNIDSNNERMICSNGTRKVSYLTLINESSYCVEVWESLIIDEIEINDPVRFRLVSVLQKLDRLKNDFIRIPKILDYGFANEGFYVVSESIDGVLFEEWNENKNLNIRIDLFDQLVKYVEMMHREGIVHGGLSEENLLVSDSNALIILGLWDIDDQANYIINEIYRPKFFSNYYQIDYYSIFLISESLFFEERGRLVDVIRNNLGTQQDTAPFNLDNLKDAIEGLQKKIAISRIFYINPSNIGSDIDYFESDNGYYYLNISKKSESDFYVSLIGKNSKLEFVFLKKNNEIILLRKKYISLTPREWYSLVSQSDKQNKHLFETLLLEIKIVKDNSCNFSSFVDYLLQETILCKHLLFVPKNLNIPIVDKKIKEREYSITALWQELLWSEKFLLPSITVLSSPEPLIGSEGSWYLNIKENINSYQYSEEDEISIISDDLENAIYYGTLNLEHSGDGYIQIDNGINLHQLSRDKILKLSERRFNISFVRREKALKKLISNDTVVPNIVDRLTNKNLDKAPNNLTKISPPSEKILEIYGLDESKKIAFKRVLETDISVVVGPPGTGKTTLLASLIDYLFRTEQIKNVLLTAQSHAAVNEVVSKYRDIVKKIRLEYPSFSKAEVGMIRVGDLSKIPHTLRDLHVFEIQEKAKAHFFENFGNKLSILAIGLNIPIRLLNDVSELFLKLGSDLTRLEEYNNSDDETINYEELMTFVDQKLCDFNISENLKDKDIIFKIVQNFSQSYLVPEEDILKFTKLAKLCFAWYEALSVDSDNYSSFLVKSRDLVVGTMVGLGKSLFNIGDSSYDVVIVDEAARANASELALAIQSAKRIIFVGDHQQLPPMYRPENIRYVMKRLDLPYSSVIKTDFERILESDEVIFLDTQYRMVPAIGNLVSELFYDGRLKTGRAESDFNCFRKSAYMKSTVTWIDTAGKSSEETIVKNEGFVNKIEVDIIIDILRELLIDGALTTITTWAKQSDEPPLGIITGYRAQKKLIIECLQGQEWFSEYQDLIRVDTIDAYQGQQSRILLFSLVRSNTHGEEGFLATTSRINVALSRAQEKLVIIGDKNHWKNLKLNTPLNKCFKYIEEKSAFKDGEYSLININNINLAKEFNERF